MLLASLVLQLAYHRTSHPPLSHKPRPEPIPLLCLQVPKMGLSLWRTLNYSCRGIYFVSILASGEGGHFPYNLLCKDDLTAKE